MPIFIAPEHPLLSSCALEVPLEDITSQETKEIIEKMLEIARGERNDLENAVMVGLAAPQIGINKRIILVDVGVEAHRTDLGTLRVFINPEIIWQSDVMVEEREGCYSVDSRLNAIVSRSDQIKIRAYNGDGELIEEEFSGFTARIFQHEIDHLYGIRFPDRVGEKGVLHWVEDEEYPEYRIHAKNWHKCISWSDWLKMKKRSAS